MLRDSNLGNSVAVEMDRLLSDQEFQSKFDKPKLASEYEEALNPDPSYKAFVRIAKKNDDDEKEDKEDKDDDKKGFPFGGKGKGKGKCKGKDKDEDDKGKGKGKCKGKEDKENEALAFKYIVNTLTTTSEALDNMGLTKSATITLALINGLMKEAATVKLGQEASVIEEMAERLEGSAPGDLLDFEEDVEDEDDPDMPIAGIEGMTMEETDETEEGEPGGPEDAVELELGDSVLDANDDSGRKVAWVVRALQFPPWNMTITEQDIRDRFDDKFLGMHSKEDIAKAYYHQAKPMDSNQAVDGRGSEKAFRAAQAIQARYGIAVSEAQIVDALGEDFVNASSMYQIATEYMKKARPVVDVGYADDKSGSHRVDVKHQPMKEKKQESEQSERERHEKDDIPTKMKPNKPKYDANDAYDGVGQLVYAAVKTLNQRGHRVTAAQVMSKLGKENVAAMAKKYDDPEAIVRAYLGKNDANNIQDKEVVALFNKINKWVKKS